MLTLQLTNISTLPCETETQKFHLFTKTLYVGLPRDNKTHGK